MIDEKLLVETTKHMGTVMASNESTEQDVMHIINFVAAAVAMVEIATRLPHDKWMQILGIKVEEIINATKDDDPEKARKGLKVVR